MLDYDTKNVAGLEVICVSGDKQGDHICLLHGYGANAYDLAPFARMMIPQGKPTPNWYFPGAPVSVDLGMGYSGQAWFPIEFDMLEEMSPQAPSVRDYSNKSPDGLDDAREKVMNLLHELELEPSKTILGGFSQGAMMTVDTMLRIEEAFKALILFSGTLVNKEEWSKLAKEHKKTNFFQSHGDADPLLKLDHAKELNRLLNDAGFQGELMQFPGGHDIPHEVIHKTTDFLSGI